LVEIVFQVDKVAIAYIMQTKGVKNFGISRQEWNKLLAKTYETKYGALVNEIQNGLKDEYIAAQQLKRIIETEWRHNEENVLTWLKEMTKLDFREPTINVCIVPFPAGQTPFKNIPLVVVGKIREGWGYPETLAHELAHILFNQNLKLDNEIEHPYVQLIEEEIAVRLGARSKYFDYEIPSFAEWAHKAQQKEKRWKQYLTHLEDYKDVSEFIRENENIR